MCPVPTPPSLSLSPFDSSSSIRPPSGRRRRAQRLLSSQSHLSPPSGSSSIPSRRLASTRAPVTEQGPATRGAVASIDGEPRSAAEDARVALVDLLRHGGSSAAPHPSCSSSAPSPSGRHASWVRSHLREPPLASVGWSVGGVTRRSSDAAGGHGGRRRGEDAGGRSSGRRSRSAISGFMRHIPRWHRWWGRIGWAGASGGRTTSSTPTSGTRTSTTDGNDLWNINNLHSLTPEISHEEDPYFVESLAVHGVLRAGLPVFCLVIQ